MASSLRPEFLCAIPLVDGVIWIISTATDFDSAGESGSAPVSVKSLSLRNIVLGLQAAIVSCSSREMEGAQPCGGGAYDFLAGFVVCPSCALFAAIMANFDGKERMPSVVCEKVVIEAIEAVEKLLATGGLNDDQISEIQRRLWTLSKVCVFIS